MLQLIGFLLCAYLCFKGAEIWMIGATAPKERGWGPAFVGALVFVAAVAIAAFFAWGFLAQGAASVGSLRY